MKIDGTRYWHYELNEWVAELSSGTIEGAGPMMTVRVELAGLPRPWVAVCRLSVRVSADILVRSDMTTM